MEQPNTENKAEQPKARAVTKKRAYIALCRCVSSKDGRVTEAGYEVPVDHLEANHIRLLVDRSVIAPEDSPLASAAIAATQVEEE